MNGMASAQKAAQQRHWYPPYSHSQRKAAATAAVAATAITNNFDECIDKQLIFHHGTILLQCALVIHMKLAHVITMRMLMLSQPTECICISICMLTADDEFVNDKIN